MSRLENRTGKDGVMRVISQQTRSQMENRELAVERFVELMHDAVKQVPIRKKDAGQRGGETSAAGREKAA